MPNCYARAPEMDGETGTPHQGRVKKQVKIFQHSARSSVGRGGMRKRHLTCLFSDERPDMDVGDGNQAPGTGQLHKIVKIQFALVAQLGEARPNVLWTFAACEATRQGCRGRNTAPWTGLDIYGSMVRICARSSAG